MTVATPDVSLVVVGYRMARELPRTIHTLLPPYQHGVAHDQIQLIVVDNGSPDPFQPDDAHARFVELMRIDDAPASPVRSINQALAAARGRLIGLLIDGARMASPGLLRGALQAGRLTPRAVVTTLGFHLGPKPQTQSTQEGYDQATEDQLLATSGWESDGYRLFDIAVLGGSSRRGWFMPLAESNALFMDRSMWDELGGVDERFTSPGGGLVNLDTLARACALPGAAVVNLLGEATFHQVHGGVATNRPKGDPVQREIRSEYRAIRGHDFARPDNEILQLGVVRPVHRSTIIESARWLDPRPRIGAEGGSPVGP